MGTTWAVLVAVGVVACTALDFVSLLVAGLATAPPAKHRRIVEGAVVGRLALVGAALFVALALLDIPLAVVGLLGIVPIAFAVISIKRRNSPRQHAINGWTSALLVTFLTGGDDVAAALVIVRWQVGHSVWPVVVVLLAGAVVVPWVAGRLGARRRALGYATATGRLAVPAQILAGVGLVVGSIVLTVRG